MATLEIRFEYDGKEFCITTEHSASSYGQPVVLVDGELTNIVPEVEFSTSERSPLDHIADAWGIHKGWYTRSKLHTLADNLLENVPQPIGADYDKVCLIFLQEQDKMKDLE